MTPIVTVVSDAAFPPSNRKPNGSGIVPQSLAKLPGLEQGQSLRIEFATQDEARKAKSGFYITARRRNLAIRLTLNDKTIQISLQQSTSVIS